MTAGAKVGGSWTDIASIHARVGGSWKGVTEGYTKVSGAWKQFYASIIEFPVEYLVIAGGGGGGTDNGTGAAQAGGAGGYRSSVIGELSGENSTAEATIAAFSGDSLFISVGAGGAPSSNGSNSILGAINSIGGGAGGDNNSGGLNGGSGGASRYDYPTGLGTSLQGHSGGSSLSTSAYSGSLGSGGGGGAGGVGGDSDDTQSIYGNGGISLSSSITGALVARGGGGGGGSGSTGTPPNLGTVEGGGGLCGSGRPNYWEILPESGVQNTGGGGGGFIGVLAPAGSVGGAGGSGTVIIRYPDSLPAITSIGPGLSYSTSTSGGYRVYQFTAGSDNITF